jgi:hypothetical protein
MDKRERPSLDKLYPRFEGLRLHPRFSTGVWLVRLRGEERERSVRWGELRAWLATYAAESSSSSART